MITFNTVDPPFNDKRVRQAVAYAIDRKFIIDKIFFGFGQPAIGPISSVFKGQGLFTDQVIHFDVPDRLKRATALLDQAGFKPKADGTRLDVTLDIGPIGDEYRRMGEYIKQALKQIGLNVTLRNEDMAGFIRRTSQTYDFQMATAAWVGMGDPTLGVQRQYVTSNIKKGVPFTNLGRYSNPEIDALWAAFATELDPKKRADDAHQLQQKLVEDSPMVWLFELQQVATGRKEVKNLITGAFSVQGGMYETWLDR
jgi:peptide/nickel transport system substrate-binding protein